jgi:intracellular sulfur oxidation DsrE/DsrF family protein
MKSIVSFIFFLILTSSVVYGQSSSPSKHRIVFQMVSKDTADHNALVRQISNILKLEPAANVEVVCHGPGLQFIQKGKSQVLDKLESLALQKVDFVGCEFTMQQKNIKKDELLDACRTVPGGILEIVYRQEEGWSYIKAGY